MTQHSLKHLVRPPAQAGRFYESDPGLLRQHVEQLLAEQAEVGGAAGAIALVTPHAGYVYSGRVAAAAYRALAGRPLERVLLLGPSHYSDFVGAALPSHRAVATPLGEIPIDQPAMGGLLDYPHFAVADSAHATEHSLEVQYPFLQTALPKAFEIVPVVLGRVPQGGLAPLEDALGNLLEQWRKARRSWVIIASTDTYHGYSAEACRLNDDRLGRMIEGMNLEGLAEGLRSREIMACGWLPLTLTMMLAQRYGARQGMVLKRSDSLSEDASSGGYVVGYLAAALV
jgi:hypothetical protein